MVLLSVKFYHNINVILAVTSVEGKYLEEEAILHTIREAEIDF